MNLVRLKLRQSFPFWFYDIISLTQEQPFSDIIDIDNIPSEFKKIIELSIRPGGPIKLVSEDSYANGAAFVKGEDLINTEDEEEQIESITVDNNKEEDDDIIEFDDEDIKKAEILLKRNGNVVKAALRNISESKSDTKFLIACNYIETENKARRGVLEAIKEVLSVRGL